VNEPKQFQPIFLSFLNLILMKLPTNVACQAIPLNDLILSVDLLCMDVFDVPPNPAGKVMKIVGHTDVAFQRPGSHEIKSIGELKRPGIKGPLHGNSASGKEKDQLLFEIAAMMVARAKSAENTSTVLLGGFLTDIFSLHIAFRDPTDGSSYISNRIFDPEDYILGLLLMMCELVNVDALRALMTADAAAV